MTNNPRALVAQLIARDPHAIPIEEALAQIAARRKELLAPPAPPPRAEATNDFDAVPFPVDDASLPNILNDPMDWGAAFVERKKKAAATKAKAKKRANVAQPKAPSSHLRVAVDNDS